MHKQAVWLGTASLYLYALAKNDAQPSGLARCRSGWGEVEYTGTRAPKGPGM